MSKDSVFTGVGVSIISASILQAANGYGNGIGYRISRVPSLSPQMLQDPGWIDVTLSRALGFPLRMIGTPSPSSDIVTIPNEPAESLGLDIDPTSPYFGQTHWRSKPTGFALMVREDLKKLHVDHIGVLLQYVETGLKELREVKQREAKGETVDRRELAARLLSPQAFKKFFEEQKAAQANIIKEANALDGVLCPSETV